MKKLGVLLLLVLACTLVLTTGCSVMNDGGEEDQDTTIQVGTLTGTVTADDQPVASAEVVLSWTSNGAEVSTTTHTGEDGTFEFTDIPYGTKTLTVSATTFVTWSGEVDISEPNQSVDVTLTPNNLGSISGRILYQYDNTPIEGVEVVLYGPIGDRGTLIDTTTTTTDIEGEFQFYDLEAGAYAVDVAPEDETYERHYISDIEVNNNDIALGDTKLMKKLIVLEPPDGAILTDPTPTFSWEPYDGAADYRVSVHGRPEGSNVAWHTIWYAHDITFTEIMLGEEREPDDVLRNGYEYEVVILAYNSGGYMLQRGSSAFTMDLPEE